MGTPLKLTAEWRTVCQRRRTDPLPASNPSAVIPREEPHSDVTEMDTAQSRRSNAGRWTDGVRRRRQQEQAASAADPSTLPRPVLFAEPRPGQQPQAFHGLAEESAPTRPSAKPAFTASALMCVGVILTGVSIITTSWVLLFIGLAVGAGGNRAGQTGAHHADRLGYRQPPGPRVTQARRCREAGSAIADVCMAQGWGRR